MAKKFQFVAWLALSILPRVPGAPMEACEVNPGLLLLQVNLLPETPIAGGHQVVQVSGKIGGGNGNSMNLADLDAKVRVFYCRRIDDCMMIQHEGSSLSGPVCKIANISESDCSVKKAGEAFNGTSSWDLPFIIIRGHYSVEVSVYDGERLVSCSHLGVMLGAKLLINKFLDYRDSFVAFGVAASASRALGRVFPTFSYGFLPQITGFLAIGVVVGPYVANLVSRYNIFLIGRLINRLSLAFIAGAAGVEIFVPDLMGLLAPMMLQVALITLLTLVLCVGGLLLVSSFGLVAVPVLQSQPSFMAQLSIALLTAALMTARSPASAIAVIGELQCSRMRICKVILGITVLGDVVVLVLFALCTNFARVTTEGGSFGPEVLLSVSIELILSCVLGFLSGQALRLVLPWQQPGTSLLSTPHLHDPANPSTAHQILVTIRGLVLIAILFATYMIAETAEEWSHEAFRMEPLLACTLASCLCGHDRGRRHSLEEAVSVWTPIVLLPFFTLAGASLQLHSMMEVLPAACTLVLFRMLGIATGSITSGLISARRTPELSFNSTIVNCTWMTLLAQAGVTLGLVLEVQSQFEGWGHELANLVIGVVVLNQLLGPVMCRIGLNWIVMAEEPGKTSREDSEQQQLVENAPGQDAAAAEDSLELSNPGERGLVRMMSSPPAGLAANLSTPSLHDTPAAKASRRLVHRSTTKSHFSEGPTLSECKEFYGSAVYGSLYH